jgi:hypothetical protein
MPVCCAPQVSFPAGGTFVDLTTESIFRGEYARLEGERYNPLGNPYLVWESAGGKPGGHRLMIVCGKVLEGKGERQELKGIQLLLVRDEDGAVKPVRRFGLGDGSFPQILVSGSNQPDISRDSDFMVRIMRSGNNTEAYVYGFDEASKKLSETLRVNRAFPGKLGVRVRGTLEQDGFAEVISASPDKKERVDMSYAIEALIEDGLYQQNARPIPSMSSLTCVRNGWEGEALTEGKGGDELRVGMTLQTPSRKQVVDVTAVLTKDISGKWTVTDYLFEPFLPYRF